MERVTYAVVAAVLLINVNVAHANPQSGMAGFYRQLMLKNNHCIECHVGAYQNQAARYEDICIQCHATHELISGQFDIIKTDATTCIDCHAKHQQVSAENKFLALYPGYQAASSWSQTESGQWVRQYAKYSGILQMRIVVWDNGPILITADDPGYTPIKVLP